MTTPKSSVYRDLLRTYLLPLWPKVLLLAVLILSGIGLQVLNPQIIRFFLDTARGNGDLQPLLLAGAVFLGSSLLLQVTTVSATYIGEDVGWTATNRLRSNLALHCLQLDMSFHNDRTPGQMIERIDGDVAALAIFFAQFVVQVLGSLLLLVGVLAVLLREDWRISAALAVYAIGALLILTRMRDVAVPQWKAARETSAELYGFLEEQLSGTEDIRSNGATAYALRNLYKFGRTRLESERRAGTASTLMVITWLGLFTVGQLIAYTSGFYFFRDGVLSLGAVYLIISYTDAIYRPLEQITEQIQNFQKAGAAIGRIQELITTLPNVRDGGRTLPQGALGLRFDGVTFAYEHTPPAPVAASDNAPDQTGDAEATRAVDDELMTAEHDARPVLDDVSFALAPGQVLGLLGRTGSGKTTITRLLFRLYEAQRGQIVLQNADASIDLTETQLEDLRARVGMVTQDVQLFRASVRDNLTFFDRTIGDERVLAVLEDLGLMGWFGALPDGLDTILAAGGAGLSAGEAQLLAFTRVFLREPGLVVLDEASSRLDPATEQLIERAIDKLLAGRTGVIIAHRLATVQRADKILILEQGRVREYGEYGALVSDPGSRFAELLRAGGMEEVLAG